LDFDQILRRTVESVNSRLQLDTFGFLLIDEEAGLVRLHPAFLGLPDEMADFSIPLGEGITGWVAQTGRPLLASDVSKEPRYRDAVPGIRSEVCVPLKVGGKVIGVMDAESTQLDAFSEEHVRLFSTLAAQLGMALENARLFEETNRRLARTRLLQEVMQAVASTLDFDEVLTRVINTLHKSLDIPYLNFAFPDEDKATMLVHPSMFGFAIPPKDFPRLPLDGSIIGRVYQTGEPLLISNVEQVPYYFEVAPTRSELAVPVRVGDQIIAVLNVESPELGAFGEEDLRILSAVAAQLGIVLENARLFEETKRRLAEARLIQEVMLAAASTLDFNLVLERVVKALNRALGIFHLGFLVPNERNDALVPHSFLADLEEAAFQVSIEGSLLGQAYRTGQPVMVRDLVQEPAYREIVPGARSALAVPVRVGGCVVAVLYAQSPQAGAFDEDELRLFTTIAGQLGVTLENARLYQRLEVQAAELSQAYSELQEINRLRTELVQNVSHELRTPLGLIKGYAALLLGGDLGPVLDSQRMALQIIHDRTKTLTRLIHNLTMLQALPQGALSLAPLSLVEVVRHALVEFRSLAKKTGITFLDELPEELPPVLGNQEQLGLAFGHLLDNAVKFSPDGGTVTLRAWADQDMVRLLVADEGIGISFEHLNRVFERFYQVDGSTSRRFGGMGVGLALVWEIIEAHGGTVNVESDVGKGSQFIVALPQATGS
ncbi:MAG: GAF domain-containing protein, partial [Chloroflexi bacterium]|nr:GAF domain-containing protein [Chloroflexota bacterium]